MGRVQQPSPLGREVVFTDFGRKKLYAIDENDEVLVFVNIVDLVEKLKPSVIVLDSLPRTQQNAVV